MRAGIKGKHSPSPKTYIYRYKGTFYRFVQNEQGIMYRPKRTRIWWVDDTGRICRISSKSPFE